MEDFWVPGALVSQVVSRAAKCYFQDTKTVLEVAPMPTNATRLSDRQLKAVKATGKDFVLSDGDGLQLRVRASGSMMWNFNYR